MNKVIGIGLVFVLGSTLSSFSQGADPEKVFKFKKKENLDKYMKENKWKLIKPESEETANDLWLYRIKSFGGGFNYVAVYPGQMVHSQKWEDEKREYAMAITYEEFQLVPEGRTSQNEVIVNELEGIKFIRFNDPSKTRNENNFYGSLTPRLLASVEKDKELDEEEKKKKKPEKVKEEKPEKPTKPAKVKEENPEKEEKPEKVKESKPEKEKKQKEEKPEKVKEEKPEKEKKNKE